MKTIREALLSEALFNKRNLQNIDYYQFNDKPLVELFNLLYKKGLTCYIMGSIHSHIDKEASLIILIPPDLDDIKKFISVVRNSNDISIGTDIDNILDDKEIQNIIERQRFFMFFIDKIKSKPYLDYGIWIGPDNTKNDYYKSTIINEIKVLNDIKNVRDLEI